MQTPKNDLPKIPTGLFKQELKVGDEIVFIARSGSYHYPRYCRIKSFSFINDNYSSYPKMIVEYDVMETTKKWDGFRYIMIDTVKKTKSKRIYNWKTAITLPISARDYNYLENNLPKTTKYI